MKDIESLLKELHLFELCIHRVKMHTDTDKCTTLYYTKKKKIKSLTSTEQ